MQHILIVFFKISTTKLIIWDCVQLKPKHLVSGRSKIVKNLELDVSLDFSSSFTSDISALLILLR